jgi:hypothetical protein
MNREMKSRPCQNQPAPALAAEVAAVHSPAAPSPDGGLAHDLLERARPALDRANQIVLELCERGEIDPDRRFRVRVKIRTRNMPR